MLKWKCMFLEDFLDNLFKQFFLWNQSSLGKQNITGEPLRFHEFYSTEQIRNLPCEVVAFWKFFRLKSNKEEKDSEFRAIHPM